ncbi:flagellar hook-length control protein FliK [Clostridium sp. MD294]|uniref:flagellar hook-length control protein FliK n=1 Tax=Clostridium sp. MD294 TaxID=97138 RepID=UPI0002CBD831|nr:flagellar hook-length control protein FliK [Clostridium sp. MD294]NDO46393.1 flagellar hook-length control protein FliK [Clostridium sp. MD294]USF29178.1 hypothetical protein C820_000561 [Clostridium sp. MD294]
MDTSVKLNDFVTMQGQVSAAKAKGSDYKNEAFYGFMQQTAQTQKTANDNNATKTNAKKDTSSKDTKNKEDSIKEKEDVTKPEKQQGEETDSKDVEQTKGNMIQQVDLAMFVATVNTNIVPVENQTENGAILSPVAQTEVLQATTEVNADITQQTAVEGNVIQQGNEKGAEQVVQQTTVQTEEAVVKEAPKEVEVEKAVEVQPKQEQKQQTEAVKTDAKVETAKATEETVVVKTEQATTAETNTNTAQTNTSEEETNIFEEEIPTTNRKTFSDDVINIKVGENAQISGGEVAQKVSDKMLAKFAQHENEFEIQLMPKELGKIVIKLVMENGQAHISMFAENAKTSSLLAEKAREISSIIEQNTGNETNVEVVDKKEMQAQDQNREAKGDGFARQKEEQQKQHQQRMQAEQSIDFIQQMRLGLWNAV